jgi:hypothetical protein
MLDYYPGKRDRAETGNVRIDTHLIFDRREEALVNGTQ